MGPGNSGNIPRLPTFYTSEAPERIIAAMEDRHTMQIYDVTQTPPTATRAPYHPPEPGELEARRAYAAKLLEAVELPSRRWLAAARRGE